MDFTLLVIPLLVAAIILASIYGFRRPTPPDFLAKCIRRLNRPTRRWSRNRQAALQGCRTVIRDMRIGEAISQRPTPGDLQNLAEHLALAFFKLTIFPRVRVFYSSLHNKSSSVVVLPNGKIAIFLNNGPRLLSRLSYTTSLVSLLLRELCVAFIILKAGYTIDDLPSGGNGSALGGTCYGLGWLNLAGNVQRRAGRLLGINDLNFEMKRKIRSEYIRSGLEPSPQQIDDFFRGEDPLVSDSGKGRIQCRNREIRPNRNDLTRFGIVLSAIACALALWLFVWLL